MRATTLKVLVVVDKTIGDSGPHRNVVTSLNALAKRSDVTLTIITGEVDFSEEFAYDMNVNLLSGRKLRNPIFYPFALFEISAWALKADIIYVPTGLRVAILCRCAAFFLRKKLVIGPNVASFSQHGETAPGWFELAICDRWLEASKYREKRSKKFASSGQKNKIEHIKHAIDLEVFSPSHKERGFWNAKGLDKERLKIIHVGRDNEQRKGVAVLLSSIKAINKHAQLDADFIFIGKFGYESRAMFSDVDNIFCFGFQNAKSVARYLANSDIAVIPSSWENMPFSVIEAIACGITVVASDTGGIPEIVNHKGNGILVDIITNENEFKPDASEILASDLVNVAHDPASREHWGRAARQTAVANFSPARLSDDLVRCFMTTLHGVE